MLLPTGNKDQYEIDALWWVGWWDIYSQKGN
jgi:hypothetical protein